MNSRFKTIISNSKAEKLTHGNHSNSVDYLAMSAKYGNISAYFHITTKHFEALIYLRGDKPDGH